MDDVTLVSISFFLLESLNKHPFREVLILACIVLSLSEVCWSGSASEVPHVEFQNFESQANKVILSEV